MHLNVFYLKSLSFGSGYFTIGAAQGRLTAATSELARVAQRDPRGRNGIATLSLFASFTA